MDEEAEQRGDDVDAEAEPGDGVDEAEPSIGSDDLDEEGHEDDLDIAPPPPPFEESGDTDDEEPPDVPPFEGDGSHTTGLENKDDAEELPDTATADDPSEAEGVHQSLRVTDGTATTIAEEDMNSQHAPM